jgi:hypothetical protein
MVNHEYGRIKVLANALTNAGMEQDIIDRIVEGDGKCPCTFLFSIIDE